MDIGQGLAMMGQSIAGTMNQYHQEHQAYDQQYQLAETLSRMGYDSNTGQFKTIDPNVKDKALLPVVDPKTVEAFKTDVHEKQVKATGALEAITQMAKTGLGHAMTLAQQNQPPSVFQGPDGTKLYRFPGGGSGVLNQDKGKGRDASAQYINAMDAHMKAMGAAKSFVTDTSGVQPGEALNGAITYPFVYKDGKYQAPGQGETPTHYQVAGQNGMSPIMSADQFNVVKKKAQDYQDLLNKMPKQEDFTGGSGGAKTGGGVVRKQGDLGNVAGQDSVWGIPPGGSRTGWWTVNSPSGQAIIKTSVVGGGATAPPAQAAPSATPGASLSSSGNTNIYGQQEFDANGNPVPVAQQ